MKVLIFFFTLLPFYLHAQVADDFDDEDLSRDPAWIGNLNSFTSINGEMRSNHSVTNSVFYLATQSVDLVNMEWRLDCRLMFNTSSVNYADFVLAADSSVLSSARNAYFVRLGGSTDEISLFRISNGVETKIIDGTDGTLNASSNSALIVVRKFGDSFVLKRTRPDGSQVTEGFCRNNPIPSPVFAGIRIRQSTSSFMNKHFFDDFYIGPIIRDSIPPTWDSLLLVSQNELRCVFNEICDSASLVNVTHYRIKQVNAVPSKVKAGPTGKTVILGFDQPFIPNTTLTLEIDSIADKAGNITPALHMDFFYSRPDTPGFHELLITEFFPDPDPQVALPMNEYIEIMNVSGKFLQLASCRIHDPTAYKMLPDIILPPDSILVLQSIPSLNNSYDHIWISNQRNEIVHSLAYTDDWYKDPDKKEGGYSLEMIDYTKPCLGEINWISSNDPSGGTPGCLNSVKAGMPADTFPPRLLKCLALSDSTLELVFNEPLDSLSLLSAHFFIDGHKMAFRLKNMPAPDRSVWIIPFIPDKTRLYYISFSGMADACGNKARLSGIWFQWPSGSRAGELLINEILFNPRSGGSDFIELYNQSGLAFDLSKHYISNVDVNGLLKNKYVIDPSGNLLKPFHYALLSSDTAGVCMEHDCRGHETLKIQMDKMPSMPDDEGVIVLLHSAGYTLDSLHYTDDWHFPLLSDKNGVSLERLDMKNPVNTKNNWHSAASTAGYATPGYQNSQVFIPKKADTYFSPVAKTLSPDEDGFEDIMVLKYELPEPDYIATVIIYDMEGRMVKYLANNVTLGTEGILTWDGVTGSGMKAPVGIYIVWIECINPNGNRIRQKFSVVVAGKF